MNKTKEKIVDNLFKKGILNTLFTDEELGRDFMHEYLTSIEQKDFNLFQNKLVNFIAKQQEETK
tara:strand:+ start:1606 stop:1797 length:192 start_codon:yes stop_codon:yes gene_type:complete